MCADPRPPVVITPEVLAAATENAVTAVLETMFFTGILEVEAPPRDTTAPSHAMRVRFGGPLHGEFRLNIGWETAQALASAMLSEPDDVSPACASQLAGELTNMLCGNLLSRLEPDANMTLGAPEPVDWLPQAGDPGCTAFVLPEGRLTIRFTLDSDSRLPERSL